MSRRSQFRLLVALTIAWAAWAGWSLLGQATPYDLRVLDDLGAPIASAVVDSEGTQLGVSGADGRIQLKWKASTVLEVSAPGHVTRTVTVSERPDAPVDTVLTARVLRGRVVDEAGGAVSAARVITSSGVGVSDSEGRFTIRGAEPGEVTVERPAWMPETFDWDGGPGETTVTVQQFVARAVHMTGDTVRDRLEEFLQMAAETELNALMIDLKDETGLVWYRTEDPTAIEVGANHNAYDLADVVARARDRGLYVVGRLVVFNDPVAAVRKPSMAVWDSDTNAPYAVSGQYFLDPTDPDARRYGLDLAVEACSYGLDEVQFDYVRFPDNRRQSATFDGGVSADVRMATINAFLAEAVSLLHPMGCAVGADVFGFITRAIDDGAIGQRWEDVAAIVDVVSPMVYPSHYSTGWYEFEVPNDHPGAVVSNALEDGLGRLPRNVVVRPWLQDFGYNTSQVREQIDSAEVFGLGWMLWNSRSNVTVDALKEAE